MSGERRLRVAFRVDCTMKVGTGHVSRCVNLGRALQHRGHEIRFFGRGLSLFLPQELSSQTLPLINYNDGDVTSDTNTWLGMPWQRDACEFGECLAEEKYDVLIVDHYGIDEKWESCAQSLFSVLVVIDDLANRAHACHLLLDYSLRVGENPYAALVQQGTRFLLGPRYCILNHVFVAGHAAAKSKSMSDFAGVKCAMISYGGSDITNATQATLSCLIYLKAQGLLKVLEKVVVVCGALYMHVENLRLEAKSAKEMVVEIAKNCSQAELLESLGNCDICIGGGGLSCFERCAVGVPSLVISISENQKSNALALHSAGAICWLGDTLIFRDTATFHLKVLDFFTDTDRLLQMRRAGLDLIDGRGAREVSQAIEAVFIQSHAITPSETKLT